MSRRQLLISRLLAPRPAELIFRSWKSSRIHDASNRNGGATKLLLRRAAEGRHRWLDDHTPRRLGLNSLRKLLESISRNLRKNSVFKARLSLGPSFDPTSIDNGLQQRRRRRRRHRWSVSGERSERRIAADCFRRLDEHRGAWWNEDGARIVIGQGHFHTGRSLSLDLMLART